MKEMFGIQLKRARGACVRACMRVCVCIIGVFSPVNH